jgi:Sulfatase-modifying factor enzyme 1
MILVISPDAMTSVNVENDAQRTQTAIAQGLQIETLTPPESPQPTAQTPTEPLSPSETPTITLTPTLDPYIKVERNEDWIFVIRRFGNSDMVLVPAGCFMMGDNQGMPYERPSSEYCFEEPFWIDQTEVTNQQYGSEG